MYIEKSRNRTSTRIRIVQKVFVAGTWKKQIVIHIGSALHELDIGILMAQAEQTLTKLRQGDQQSLKLFRDPPTSRLQRIGSYRNFRVGFGPSVRL